MRTRLNLSWLHLIFMSLMLILAQGPVLPAAAQTSLADEAQALVAPNGSATSGLSSTEIPINQLIIRYRESVRSSGLVAPASSNQIQRLSDTAGMPLAYFREMSGEAHVLQLPERLPTDQVWEIARKLMLLPEVEYAEPDAIMLPTLTPNDSQYGQQWHYFSPSAGNYGINAPGAWDITTGSASIVVAVIDTGITNHADLSGRTVQGYDFMTDTVKANDGGGRDPDPSDPGDWVVANECYAGSPARNSTWHGTHTAGTIGAATNNSLGVAGVDWQSKILPVRVLGKCGGSLSDIADGMRWSAGLAVTGVPNNANPAKVLNLSLGGEGACETTYQDAINAITAAGSIVIVSAGNSNADASGFRPANCNGVITVAATNRNGNRANYSNYGSVVEISAPGGETGVSSANGVLSTLNTGTQGPGVDTYTFYQGTSMSAPHVSGVVALMYSRNPSLTSAQVKYILQNTVTPFPGGSSCNTSICGRGILNASNAVANALSPPILDYYVFLPLIIKSSGPTPGFWKNPPGAERTEFYVSPDGLNVLKFLIGVDLEGCGTYNIWKTGSASINNNKFSFSGGLYASGTFDSATAAHGTAGLNSIGPICGFYWTGGPWPWSATWQNSSQPTSLSADAMGYEFVESAPAIQGAYTAIPVK